MQKLNARQLWQHQFLYSTINVFHVSKGRKIAVLITVFFFHLLTDLVSALPEKGQIVEEQLQALLPSLTRNIETGKTTVEELAKVLVDFAESSPQLPLFLKEWTFSVPGFEQALGVELVTRSSSLLKEKNAAEIIGLKKLGETFLKQDDENLRLLLRLFLFVEKIDYLVSVGKLGEAIQFRKHGTGEKEQDIIEFKLTQALTNLINNELERENPARAIQFLGKISPDRRDEKINALVTKALEQFIEEDKAEESWPFDDQEVNGLMKEASSRDPSVKAMLVQIYTARILECVDKNDIQKARKYFATLVQYRPDPNEENVELRVEIAQRADSEEGEYFAREQVSALRMNNQLTWMRKVRLLLSGYYGRIFHILFFLSIFIAGGSIFLAYKLPTFSNPFKKEEEAPPPERKTVLDEYTELLAHFRLTENATEDEIKQAYRHFVKSYHPDSQIGNSSADRTEQFLDLKRTYERILEIKRSRFS